MKFSDIAQQLDGGSSCAEIIESALVCAEASNSMRWSQSWRARPRTSRRYRQPSRPVTNGH